MLNPNLVFHERCANKLCTMSWHIFLCTMSRHLSPSYQANAIAEAAGATPPPCVFVQEYAIP
jgi:hypothetical protein